MYTITASSKAWLHLFASTLLTGHFFWRTAECLQWRSPTDTMCSEIHSPWRCLVMFADMLGNLVPLCSLTSKADAAYNIWDINSFCKIWGSHDCDYVQYHLLRCNTIYSVRNTPVFQKNQLPTYSGLEALLSYFCLFAHNFIGLWLQLWYPHRKCTISQRYSNMSD